MKFAVLTEQMPVASSAVFNLLHDYERRLDWDTLLREARLTRGSEKPEKGATSICVGKPLFGLIGIETRYVAFEEAKVAAVTMINNPPFFAKFTASIRHKDNSDGSLLTYQLQFSAKPRILRWILEPIMLWALKAETKKRLRSLSDYLAASRG